MGDFKALSSQRFAFYYWARVGTATCQICQRRTSSKRIRAIGEQGPRGGPTQRPATTLEFHRKFRRRTPKRTRASAVASPVHEFPDLGDNDGTFTNRGSDALDRSRPDIADRKDPRA